jgi:uncharacterized coiled-coil DUF342 family protein
MKSKTETITAALRALANDIQSPDDVFATCLREAADSLEWLTRERDTEQKRADGHYENYCEILKQIDRIANQRDKAWDEIERLKAELHDTIESYKLNNLQPKTTRPEPSRLEIAAWLKAGWFANRDADFNAADHGWWVEQADKLIVAAREAQ